MTKNFFSRGFERKYDFNCLQNLIGIIEIIKVLKYLSQILIFKMLVLCQKAIVMFISIYSNSQGLNYTRFHVFISDQVQFFGFVKIEFYLLSNPLQVKKRSFEAFIILEP